MTKAQKIEAFSMRLEGCTYQAIGVKFGVTRQAVQQDLYSGSSMAKDKIKYINLRRYMKENDLTTIKSFAEHLGLRITSSSVYYFGKKLKGDAELSISEIKNILNVTGLTFEEAFKEE